MNEKLIKLISCLRDNSREKLTKISKTTGVPVSTLFDSIKILQKNIIHKNTVLLNFSELGYHTRAMVFLKTSGESKESLRNHLSCNNSVNSFYKINNGWDFMIETIHPNVKDLDFFLENISQRFGLENQEIHYLIDEIKKEEFKPDHAV